MPTLLPRVCAVEWQRNQELPSFLPSYCVQPFHNQSRGRVADQPVLIFARVLNAVPERAAVPVSAVSSRQRQRLRRVDDGSLGNPRFMPERVSQPVQPVPVA